MKMEQPSATCYMRDFMRDESLTDITEIYSDAEKAWLSENHDSIRAIIANTMKTPPSEITDVKKLIEAVEESLSYFCEEFPDRWGKHAKVWESPVSYHCGGITPNDLDKLLTYLYLMKPVPVSLEKCADAASVQMRKHLSRYWDYESHVVVDIAKAVLDAAGVKYVD